jgi:hypothetical protein
MQVAILAKICVTDPKIAPESLAIGLSSFSAFSHTERVVLKSAPNLCEALDKKQLEADGGPVSRIIRYAKRVS